MIINSTELDGVYAIENRVFHDHRGTFVKTFHNELFTANGLNTDFKESFYSVSKKGVVRGMHFQNAPDDHAKLVYVTDGEILDLIVDVRSGSPTLGRYVSLTLSAGNAKSVYIGKGFAHGFLTLTESATVVYSTTTVHSPASDTGIRWDSFGFDWGVQQPIISERDLSFPTLAQFAGKKLMKVGIAIPTYNRKELLNGLLDSIPDGFHIYVSDNGNFVTDFLKNNHRVNNIVTHNVVIPMFSNWNASIEAAHGCDYIAITSDDDTYEKNAYAVVSKYVSEYDADVFIFGHKYINGDSAVLGSYCPKRLELHASPNGLAEHFLGVDARMPSIFLKKTFLDEIGYFDDQTFTITAADSELIQRALLLGKVLYVPEVIASYRVWEGSLTNSTQATTKWLTEVDLWTKKIASLAVSSFSESTKNIYDWRLYSDEIFARNLLAGLSILYKQKSYKEISIHLKNNRIPQYASIKTKIRISKYMILACIKRLYGA